MGNRQGRRSTAARIAQAYRSAHEVMSAAYAIAGLAALGYWIDLRLKSAPVALILGAGAGMVFGGFSLMRLLKRLDQEAARKRNGHTENVGRRNDSESNKHG